VVISPESAFPLGAAGAHALVLRTSASMFGKLLNRLTSDDVDRLVREQMQRLPARRCHTRAIAKPDLW